MKSWSFISQSIRTASIDKGSDEQWLVDVTHAHSAFEKLD